MQMCKVYPGQWSILRLKSRDVQEGGGGNNSPFQKGGGGEKLSVQEPDGLEIEAVS